VVDPAWRAHVPATLRIEAEDLTREGTLVRAWVARWDADPEQQVLHDPRRGWVTAAQLDQWSRRVAVELGARGVGRGCRVLLSAATTIELVVVHIALLRLGAVVVPVNGAYREREVTHIVRDCRPIMAVVDDAQWAPWIASVDPQCAVMSVDEAAVTDLDGAVDTARDGQVVLDAVGADAPAMIGYTSGTTGAPKGAVLSHGNLLASVAALAIAWRWTRDDRLVLCLPLFHMHGLGVGLHGTLYAGASAVLLDGFDVDEVIDAIDAHAGTLFFGVPTMYHRLVDSDRVGELAKLRLCVAGSAALSPSVHEAFRAATGRTVLERYGMTETVMLVSNPYDGERRAGAVGIPLPGVETRFTRDDRAPVDLTAAGRDGKPGEVLVRGPNVFRGYWERPASNVAAFTDGWFRTGDLATVAPDGYITIVGRAKELIISGGFNVYPREVEEVVASHPAVAEVAVVGTPSNEWGEEVTAFIVVRPGHPAPGRDDVREFCREQLARFKLPRRIVIVDTLPRNALGKVVKHELRCPP
jgi:malonyl-CoA/methylmalonyl-CoA synthetase